jgi:hypothetical protein
MFSLIRNGQPRQSRAGRLSGRHLAPYLSSAIGDVKTLFHEQVWCGGYGAAARQSGLWRFVANLRRTPGAACLAI